MLRPLAAALLLVVAPLGAQPRLSADQQLARDVLRELVEINTADSVGSVTAAAEAMARRFRDAGFPAEDVRLLVPDGQPTKGNLVVRYRTRVPNGERPVLLVAHLDVVAANRADWASDPFVLREENGFFVARGVADDKGHAALFVATLLKWKRDGWAPRRDVILALTADEEGGGSNGVQWLLANHRELVDAAYALNEGAFGALAGDRPLYLGFQATEKRSANFTLTVTNPGGHSSIPRPDNAIYQLAHALERIESYTFPVALNDVSRAYFTQTARVVPPDVAAAMRAIVANPSDAAAAARLSRDPTWASMLRTTCVATRLAGGHANNALPQRATATVNCRIVPTSSAAEAREALVRVIADTGVRVSPVGAGATWAMTVDPIDPQLLAATTATTRALWGDVPIIPLMSTWTTDGRLLRDAGIPTYGVNGLFTVPGEERMHGLDEKLRVRSFYDGLAFTDRLLRQIAGAPGA
ncbi:peptidase M20 [Gemmatirosa kalamazoonensis]|uniref:Peptidase M20 n=1 Tax=Gemmatirosa kalamazoonensis TaxID=861299 RepID=W0RE47_9BACT|nr:M20/M25/M40 family metallo-hydrolase [Gemmatirosa kalamazoonensis]AHG89086.1 peptidase M20 [Gemmatirosa kalamazoonensis]